MLYDQLLGFQKDAVAFAVQQPNTALFFDQGTGKTWVTAALIEQLVTPSFRCLLVVPLTNLETTWVPILEKIIPIARSYEEFLETPTPCALLIHYEAMPTCIRGITHTYWDLAVFDESQRLKARGTRQSRIAARIRNADRRLILSGTPIEQAPQDLWAQFRFVAPQVFGRRWKDFDEQFLLPTGYMGYQREFRREMLPLFLSMIGPHILRVEREVLQLPPISYHHEPVMLLGHQAKVYRELESEMVSALRSGVVSAGLKITQLVRLQQICGGFVCNDDGDIVQVGRAKLRRVRALIRRLPKPIVVFCKYTEELAQIVEVARAANCSVAIIDGKTRRTRTETLNRFQAGEIDVLVAQVRTGGVGVDLFASSNLIFYSTTFSFIDFEQAIARLHRYGQVNEVKVFLLYAEETVDEDIFEAIIFKRKVSDLVLRRFRSRGSNAGGMVMAKKVKLEAKSDPATGAVNVKPKDEKPEFKYGVADLAEALGISPASVRIKLRTAEVEKAGKSYGWNSEKEFQALVKMLKTAKKEKGE